jgi:hypothetical protein
MISGLFSQPGCMWQQDTITSTSWVPNVALHDFAAYSFGMYCLSGEGVKWRGDKWASEWLEGNDMPGAWMSYKDAPGNKEFRRHPLADKPARGCFCVLTIRDACVHGVLRASLEPEWSGNECEITLEPGLWFVLEAVEYAEQVPIICRGRVGLYDQSRPLAILHISVYCNRPCQR